MPPPPPKGPQEANNNALPTPSSQYNSVRKKESSKREFPQSSFPLRQISNSSGVYLDLGVFLYIAQYYNLCIGSTPLCLCELLIYFKFSSVFLLFHLYTEQALTIYRVHAFLSYIVSFPLGQQSSLLWRINSP